jgi:hypothetical protein
MGSFGVQPGPWYLAIDTRPALSIGVWLEVEMNSLVGILLSIFSMFDRHSLREMVV